KSDHDVVIIAEGLSVSRWRKEGFDFYFQGTTDYRDEPFTVDAAALLKRVKPDIVVTGLSSPINLEEQFTSAANILGIPVVWLNDFWGGSARNNARPDMIFTIDHIDEKIVKENPRFAKVWVSISGNLALNALENFSAPEDVARRMNELKKPVILLAGGGASTTSVIEILVESLRMTPGDWTLVPRLHPKHAKRQGPDGRTYGEIWNGLLAEFGERVVEIPTDNADAIAMLADITVSPFSTLLLPSVVAKKIPVSVRTPEMVKDLEAQTGLTHYPLVEAGAVIEMAAPRNIKSLVDNAITADLLTEGQAKYLTKAKPFDSRRVSREILSLVE
ncbi:MAG: hypothetical protein WAP51_04690, partial [Candidatus Sungiibacteriota bacterium]